MMLRHDPTFEGLLSAIAICLRDGIRPEALIPDLDQLTLLPCTDAPLVPGIRGIFYSQLTKRMNAAKAEQVLTTIWHAYLSEDEGIGLAIFQFLTAAIKRSGDPSGDLLDRDIARVVRMAQKTSRLAHAFLGLIRFRTVGPSLFLADFSPEHHVLPLVLPHFCERLPDQCFVIRDQRRGLAALHLPHRAPQIFVLAPPGEDDPMDGTSPLGLPIPGQLFELPSGLAVNPPPTPARTSSTLAVPAPASTSSTLAVPTPAPSSAEKGVDARTTLAASEAAKQQPFDELWRHYLAALTIPERRNLKLQRSHMPKKYWKYLTEHPGGS